MAGRRARKRLPSRLPDVPLPGNGSAGRIDNMFALRRLRVSRASIFSSRRSWPRAMVPITAITPITLGGIARMRRIALAAVRCRADHARTSGLRSEQKNEK